MEPVTPAERGSATLDAITSFSDLNTLVLTGGRERTEAEYRAPSEAVRPARRRDAPGKNARPRP